MLRVLLITLTVLAISVSSGSASPLDALNINLISGMESDQQAAPPSGLLLGDLQLVLPSSPWRAGIGFGTSIQGRDQLTMVPLWHASMQYRFDVIELIPYVEGGILGELNGSMRQRAFYAVGIERVYQTGWHALLELGGTVVLDSKARHGAIILLGLGYQYTLNALY